MTSLLGTETNAEYPVTVLFPVADRIGIQVAEVTV
jgi:hypothetical protein